MAAAPTPPTPPAPEPGIIDGFFIIVTGVVMLVGFVDFMRGVEGQKRVRQRLENWWLSLQYTKWRDLGKREASTFLGLMDRVFGLRLVSLRRLVSAFALTLLILAMGVGIRLLIGGGGVHFLSDSHRLFLDSFLTLMVYVVPLGIGIWVTQWVGRFALNRPGTKIPPNLFFLAVLYVQIVATSAISVILGYASVFVEIFDLYVTMHTTADPEVWIAMDKVTQVAYFIPDMRMLIILSPMHLLLVDVFLYLKQFEILYGQTSRQSPMFLSHWLTFLVPPAINLIRLLAAGLFLLCWLFGATLRGSLSAIVLRLAETEKGTLTLVAGGIGAAAKLIQEAIKRWPLF